MDPGFFVDTHVHRIVLFDLYIAYSGALSYTVNLLRWRRPPVFPLVETSIRLSDLGKRLPYFLHIILTLDPALPVCELMGDIAIYKSFNRSTVWRFRTIDVLRFGQALDNRSCVF